MTIQPEPSALAAASGAQAAAPRIFHHVMNATLVEVRQALSAMRLRFDGSADADALDRLELVLAEVLNNIALHGSNGQPAAGALAVEGLPDERDWTGGPDGQIDSIPEGSGARPIVIRLTVTQHASGLACAVVDDGSPLPDGCLVPPGSAASPEVLALRASGFGWLIIRELSRTLFYFREDDQNVLCFDIPLHMARVSGQRAISA